MKCMLMGERAKEGGERSFQCIYLRAVAEERDYRLIYLPRYLICLHPLNGFWVCCFM